MERQKATYGGIKRMNAPPVGGEWVCLWEGFKGLYGGTCCGEYPYHWRGVVRRFALFLYMSYTWFIHELYMSYTVVVDKYFCRLLELVELFDALLAAYGLAVGAFIEESNHADVLWQ